MTQATAVLNQSAGHTGSTTVRVYEASAYTWAGAAAWLKGSGTGTNSYNIDLTAHVRAKLNVGSTATVYGLESDASVYNFKDFGFGLRLVINDGPPAATSPTPGNGTAYFAKTATSAPTLSVPAVTDPTLAPGWTGVKYHFSVSKTPAGAAGYWGEVAHRDSQYDRTFALSPSVLKDGHTYYWRVWTSDGAVMTPSAIFAFRYDRRLGTSGPSPYTDVGPVKVNAATGNAMFTWSQRNVATLGGGAGVSLTYNSLLTQGTSVVEASPGLPAGWTASWSSLPVTRAEITPGGSAVVRLADGGKEAFTWSANNWKPAEPYQFSIFRTTGSTYQWEDESGWLVNFDAAGNVTTATHHGDDVSPTSLGYEWGTAAGTVVLRKVIDPVVPSQGRLMQLHYGGDAQCPAGPPPSGVAAAPSTMLCKIVHMDGSASVFWYTPGPGTQQIARIVDDANGDLDSGSDDQAVWDLGWISTHQIGSVRDPHANRLIAASVAPDTADRLTELVYDSGTGRVTSVTGPKPDATHSRPGVTFAYPSDTVTTATDVNRSEPNGYTTRWTTDARGRAVKVEDRMGRATHTKWETADIDRVQWTDTQSLTAAGATSFLRSSTNYDDRGRPTESWGPAPRSEFGATTEADGTVAGGANTPLTITEYDGGITGLGLTFWGNQTQAGKPAAHGHIAGGAMTRAGVPHPLVVGKDDDWSMRASGSIQFPAAGTYTMRMVSYGPVRMVVKDVPLDSWSVTDPGGASAIAPTVNVTVAPGDVGKWFSIVIDSRDTAGTGGINLQWTPPGGTLAQVPAANLRPDFGLVTKTTTRVDGSTNQVISTSYDDPATTTENESYLGIARVTTQDPTGAARQTIETFEAPGSGFLRRTSRQLPSGAGSKVDYEYYTPTGGPISSGATACGVSGSTPQLGMLKRTVQADPDGTGPETSLVREYVYDSAGRQVGYRASTDVSSEPWTCTSFDDAGRVDAIDYPAWNGQPARTVSHDYMVGGDPRVTSVTDPAGTITTTSDWAGRTTSTEDVWGFTTTVAYDNHGRVTTASNPAGVTGYAYNGDDQVTQQTLDGDVVAVPSYDTLGRMTGVTYPAGSGNGGNGTSGVFTFDDHGRPASVTWIDPSSGLVTSDAVTSRDQISRVLNRSTDGHDPNGTTANYGYSTAGDLTWAIGFAAAPGPSAATRTFVYGYAASGGCGVAATAGANVNRTSKTIDTGTPVTYCYDHADRLTATSEPAETVSITAGTLAYDSHGNTSRLGDEVYTYDIADRHFKTSAAPSASGVPTVEYVRDASDGIVQRSLNGTVTGRYAATAAGAPSAVLNGSNIAISATVGLPGGTSYSFDPRINTLNGTWHHPNLTGHRVATTNTAGAKTGSTTVYDPDGNLQAGTLPDDKPGDFDATWHGGGGVNLEHEAGLHPMIQMGARQYSPILARFLEVDPIEGGVNNDYGYVSDAINQRDLTGAAVTGFCLSGSIGAFVVASISACFLQDAKGWAMMGTFSWGAGVALGVSVSWFYAGATDDAADLRSRNRYGKDQMVCVAVSVLEYGGEHCTPGVGSRGPSTLMLGLGVGVGEISVKPNNYTGVTRLKKDDKRLALALVAYRAVK